MNGSQKSTPELRRSAAGFTNRPIDERLLGVSAYSAAMDPKETTRLQEAWKAKGSPPCDHPRKEKERLNGMQTGDKVCTTCGEEFWAG